MVVWYSKCFVPIRTSTYLRGKVPHLFIIGAPCHHIWVLSLGSTSGTCGYQVEVSSSLSSSGAREKAKERLFTRWVENSSRALQR